MDITTKSVTELKALAFDTLVSIEQQQNNLRAINAEIAKRNQKADEPVSSQPTA